MVNFTTEPQAPLTTIFKSTLTAHTGFQLDKHYKIKIVFVDIELGRKYANVYNTNEIINDDYQFIYEDRFKFGIKDYHLRIRNHSPLWNVLRKLLIHDGLLSKTNDGAILITPTDLKEYLTNCTFTVMGKNIHDYRNVSIPGGDSE